MTNNLPAVSVKGLHKSFGSHEVLKGIDLAAHDGNVISLIGASGSGKSTLLRCIPMLEIPNSGSISVGEAHITPRDGKLSRADERTARAIRRDLGFVFQNFNLWPHRTVLQNVVEAPMIVQRRNKAECRDEAMALLEKVGLSDKADAWPNQLSGGSSNVSPSPGRWRRSRARSCLMNRPRRWIRNLWARC